MTTAAGVDAFIRGDYQEAVAILTVITERSPKLDHVAEFILAALYTNGLGVPANAVRGCALYVRAMADRVGPIGSEAAALVSMLRQSLSMDDFDECNWRAAVGFDHRFEPVTLVLGQGHWIAFDLRGAALTYEGKEKRLDMDFAVRGAVFLPVEHVELAVGPIGAMPRHFISLYRWVPANDEQKWTLIWTLFEVVRDDLVLITIQRPMTVAGNEPPSVTSFDVHQVARVLANDDGDPEWVLVNGSNSSSTLIERRR